MRFIVEEGYNRGALYVVGDEALVFGRGEGCGAQLLDESVSRQHAEVRREGSRAFVRDLGSRNGIRCRGKIRVDWGSGLTPKVP
ncbi:FHA domain-containing protein, partial [Planctomycetota bacterium]